jgi:hypothetical protein
MIAGYREDRRRVVAERSVELVVIVLRLAEVIHHIAEVQQERWPVGDVFDGAVHRQLVGDAQLVGILLTIHRRAGIADRMEHDPPGLLDLLGDCIPPLAERLGKRIERGRLNA